VLATLAIWLWIAVLVWITVGSAISDWRAGHSAAELALELISGSICIAAVLSLWRDSVAIALGRLLLPLAITAGVILLRGLVMDLREMGADQSTSDESSRNDVAIGVSLFGITFGAAVASGIVLGLRLW